MRFEKFPQPGHVLLECSGRVFRRVVAPELLDQAIARDDGARFEQQEGEDASLLCASEAKLPVALPDLERTEDAEL